MHAKMTRDRKKCFITTMEKAIEELEKELNHLRSSLSLDSTNSVTPELTARPSPSYTSTSMEHDLEINDTDSSLLFPPEQDHQPKKRTCHGFSLYV
jgi:hypothetical protein